MIKTIEDAFEGLIDLQEASSSVFDAIRLLDQGEIRIAQKKDSVWHLNLWVKKAILLYFKIQKCVLKDGYYDKIPLKFTRWTQQDYEDHALRVVPGSVVRYGSFLEKNVIVMPSFVNIGAYVGQGTMIDTWATIGSCAQIGSRCHISGGAGIGGVLEPLQANPVIIEDNCFIGARSEVAEGVIIEEGSVLSMGVYLSASTKILNRQTGEVFQGKVPAYSVVVPGVLPSSNLYCAVIVKTVDSVTRSKTAINELLRM